MLTPSAFVHLSIHEKGGHFVRLQAARLKSELILAAECLGREKDFGGPAPSSQQCGQQAAANHGTAPSAAFYYAFSIEASSKQPENNL